MLSVSDMFYNGRDESLMVVDDRDRGRAPVRRGFLTRQDSRNFRSSASPPPSRVNNHASSWFGHRNGSRSPPRGRNSSSQSDYYDRRDSRYGRSPERSGLSSIFGRRGSQSPERSSYHEAQTHTKYKEDYTGYPLESGYTAEDGYQRGYGSVHGGRSNYGGRGYGTDGYAIGAHHQHASSIPGYASQDLYHGAHTSAVPRSYQSSYGGAPAYSSKYAETVKLKVPLCCEACEERITNHMLALEGVESVTCDEAKQKVTVRGTASPSDILRQGRECFKQTRFW